MTIAVSAAESPAVRVGAKSYDVSLGYLRAFVTFLVVLHHSVLAYAGMPLLGVPFSSEPMLWRAFPVIDAGHVWGSASLVSGFNDIYFMSLMFLLSGLFVNASVGRKGIGGFLRDRFLRLGIPFLFAAGIVTPIAYYFAYLQSGGAPGLANYWDAWLAIGYWPTGPAWFILLLLVFDIAAAILFTLAPRWGEAMGALAGRIAERPWRFIALMIVMALVVYAPMSLTFGTEIWTYWEIFQFQTSRPFLYFLFFSAGIALGAYGIGRGLLAPDGKLARRWWLWLLILTPLSFLCGLYVFFTIIGAFGPPPAFIVYVGPITFVTTCVLASFGWIALFVRFVRRANPVMDGLAANAYGIYILHYAFVAGLQYALLPPDLPGFVKAMIVTFGALGLSWATSAAIRRIPVASRLMGE